MGHLKKYQFLFSLKNETSEEWLKRHESQGHVTEEWTPERPFETRSLYCHDCNENAKWKHNKKITR